MVRHVVWLLATLAAGGGALWFIHVERWSLLVGERLRGEWPYAQAVVVGVGLVVIMRLRDRLFPGTEGTGIPQAIAALKLGDSPARGRLLSLRILVGKLLLLSLGLLAGATIGREGPTVHVAACCLYLAARWVTFPPAQVERGLILAGGAAGIGAAFNAPLAGLVFAIEELGRSFEKENASLLVRTTLVATLLCLALLGPYLFYGRVEATLPSVRAWLWLPVIGVLGGLLGGVFAQAVAQGVPRVARLGARRPYAVAGSLGLGLAVLGVLSGGLSYGDGDPQVLALLRGEALPATYPLTKAAASFLSLLSGIPGGLFAPSLSVGAGIGHVLSPFATDLPREAILLLTMAAYFCGVVQSPITAAIIVVEMTGAAALLLPLLVTTLIAFHASRLVCPVALYEALAEAFLKRQERISHGAAEGRRAAGA